MRLSALFPLLVALSGCQTAQSTATDEGSDAGLAAGEAEGDSSGSVDAPCADGLPSSPSPAAVPGSGGSAPLSPSERGGAGGGGGEECIADGGGGAAASGAAGALGRGGNPEPVIDGEAGAGAADGGADADGGASGAGGASSGGVSSGGVSSGGVSSGGAGANANAGGGSGGAGEAGAGGAVAGAGGSSSGGSSAEGGEPGAGGISEPVGGAGGGPPSSGLDAFGIRELYDSAASGARWDSTHWASTGPYSLSERRDENDPSGLSGMRGDGELEVTEDGELVMSGSEPRIYVYPEEGSQWLNVEVTVYYQRVADQDTGYAGLVIGVRSGPDGHTSENACDAHTYYSRLRNDGSADFEKELEHTPSTTRANTELDDFLPPNGEASEGTWVGWKYVSYDIPGEDALKLEAYIDLTGGEDGGDWQLVNQTTDDGGWFTNTDCAEYSPSNGESDYVWLDGGTVFIRNTNVDEARYRWVSIREITPR